MSLYHSLKVWFLAIATLVSAGAASLLADQADLIVKDFHATGTPQWNGSNLEIPVQFKVQNQGEAATTINIVNSVRVSGVDRWTGFMGTLTAGQTKTVNAVVKVADPNKLLSGRTLQLQAYADAPIAAADTSIQPYGRIDESNDNNNTASIQVQVPGGLQLKGEKPAAPGSGRPNGFKASEPARLPMRIGKRG